MRRCAAILALLLAPAAGYADDFEDRFKAAAAKIAEFDAETRNSGAAELLKLADEAEERLPGLLRALDVDTSVWIEVFLAEKGYYYDRAKTRRAREIIAELNKPVLAQPVMRFGRSADLPAPDPERRTLVAEYIGLGSLSVAKLARELSEFSTEPVQADERVFELGKPAAVSLSLKNVGEAALWFLPQIARGDVTIQKVHFDVACVAYMRMQQVCIAPTDKSDEDQMIDVLAVMQRVPPGQTFEYATVNVPTEVPGVAIITSSVLPGGTSQFRSRTWQFPLIGKFDGQEVALELRGPFPTPGARAYVLGALEDSRFNLQSVDADAVYRLEITATAARVKGDPLPEYCWWLAEGAGGVVLGKGVFGRASLATTEWRTDAPVRVAVDEALPVGTMRLWLGFQCENDTRARVAEALPVTAK